MDARAILAALTVAVAVGCSMSPPDPASAAACPNPEPSREPAPEPPLDPPLDQPAQPRMLWLALTAPLPDELDEGDFVPFTSEVAVIAEVPYPIHVYLARVSAKGEVELLWPPDEPRLVERGPLRIPEQGWLSLDDFAPDDWLAFVTIHEGETIDFDFVTAMVARGRAYGAAEGTYMHTLERSGAAVRADVWAEDETLILLDLNR